MYDEEDHVYTGNKKALLPVGFVGSFYPKFLDWSGVDRRSFTALKNTFVKLCFDSGTDIETISRLIGDSDKKFTIKRYFEIKHD